jgi:hypothetical protein
MQAQGALVLLDAMLAELESENREIGPGTAFVPLHCTAECMFRGFLEPQMPNGHTIGWRH